MWFKKCEFQLFGQPMYSNFELLVYTYNWIFGNDLSKWLVTEWHFKSIFDKSWWVKGESTLQQRKIENLWDE